MSRGQLPLRDQHRNARNREVPVPALRFDGIAHHQQIA
jgi:hypothetical protein